MCSISSGIDLYLGIVRQIILRVLNAKGGDLVFIGETRQVDHGQWPNDL